MSHKQQRRETRTIRSGDRLNRVAARGGPVNGGEDVLARVGAAYVMQLGAVVRERATRQLGSLAGGHCE